MSRADAPYLEPIPSGLREMAVEALERGDVLGFFCRASNEYALELLTMNSRLFRARGLLEAAFIHAVTATRTNNRCEYGVIELAVSWMDRGKLLAAGDAPPGDEPWTVYRGVAGHGRARKVRGYSWTSDPERARWFAERGRFFGLADPAVFTATISRSELLFYCADREESEFFVQLDPRSRLRRV